jgi:hypothetical protein
LPVNNEHKFYQKNRRRWETVRDCIEGEDVIKEAGDRYLPKLTGQNIEDYKRYKEKAQFFGGTGRAADGMHGDVFSKPPQHTGEVPDELKELIKDVDLMGTSLDQFASDIVWDNMQTNWGGVLVDYSKDADALTLKAAEEAGCKAFLKWYPAEKVINWEYRNKDGRNQLVMVVLEEPCVEKAPGDMFSGKPYTKYRLLSFDEKGDYIQSVYDSRVSLDVPSEDPITPKVNGASLKRIPFFTCPGREPEKSMLLDLAYQNISHYRQSADYENGKHYTSIPTPVALGYNPDLDEAGKPKPVSIGGTNFLFFNNETGERGEVKYLEFGGSGIESLHKGMESTEERMAILGAHIITREKKGVESAAAAKIHRAGENGVLSAFIRNISEQLTLAMRLKAVWDGLNEEAMNEWSYELNTDYDLIREDAQVLSVLLNGRNSGEIPKISMFRALKNIELIPDEWDFDTFLEETENDSPPPQPVAIPPADEQEQPPNE